MASTTENPVIAIWVKEGSENLFFRKDVSGRPRNCTKCLTVMWVSHQSGWSYFCENCDTRDGLPLTRSIVGRFPSPRIDWSEEKMLMVGEAAGEAGMCVPERLLFFMPPKVNRDGFSIVLEVVPSSNCDICDKKAHYRYRHILNTSKKFTGRPFAVFCDGCIVQLFKNDRNRAKNIMEAYADNQAEAYALVSAIAPPPIVAAFQDQPIKTAIAQDQPIKTTIAQDQPIKTAIAQDQPIKTAITDAKAPLIASPMIASPMIASPASGVSTVPQVSTPGSTMFRNIPQSDSLSATVRVPVFSASAQLPKLVPVKPASVLIESDVSPVTDTVFAFGSALARSSPARLTPVPATDDPSVVGLLSQPVANLPSTGGAFTWTMSGVDGGKKPAGRPLDVTSPLRGFVDFDSLCSTESTLAPCAAASVPVVRAVNVSGVTSADVSDKPPGWLPPLVAQKVSDMKVSIDGCTFLRRFELFVVMAETAPVNIKSITDTFFDILKELEPADQVPYILKAWTNTERCNVWGLFRGRLGNHVSQLVAGSGSEYTEELAKLDVIVPNPVHMYVLRCSKTFPKAKDWLLQHPQVMIDLLTGASGAK